MKNIIFIAPPAAGKGTISDYLVKNYNYVHLSTGDLLRTEVSLGTLLGKEIDELITKGKLVSDDLIISLVNNELTKLNGRLFILDGFPRTLGQARKLDQMLASLGVTNNVVIYLDIDVEEASKRALGRVICPNCKRSYHLYNEGFKPLNDNLCDDCNTVLEKRSDDTEATFKNRFLSYLTNTGPVIDYYKKQNRLVKISINDKSITDVIKEVIKVASEYSTSSKEAEFSLKSGGSND